MLTSKTSMLSTLHAIFRGLQKHIQQIYRDLPLIIPPRIKAGLLTAHKKLSEYYYKYNQSPFYTWAACEFFAAITSVEHVLQCCLVLDPRISYEGAQQDYANDPELLDYLESAKSSLHTHYALHYATCMPHALDDVADATGPISSAAAGTSSAVDFQFTMRYNKRDHLSRDKLEEYFKLPREDFNACKPLQWWVGWRAQFPMLYCLARDLLTIPGMYSFIY